MADENQILELSENENQKTPDAQDSAAPAEGAEADAAANPSTLSDTESTSESAESSESETNTSIPSDTTEPAESGEPETAGDLPLGEAASDASPAPVEIDGPGAVRAPAEPAEPTDSTTFGGAPTPSSEAMPAEPMPADASNKEDTSNTDGTSKLDAPSKEDKAAEYEGDAGQGATHDGTDTPEVMLSHPCDPVTGRPLDGNTGLSQNPIFGGGQSVGPASPSGHVLPGQGEPTGGSSQSEAGEGDEGEEYEYEEGEEDAEEGEEFDLETVAGLQGFAASIQEQLNQLVDALDGFED